MSTHNSHENSSRGLFLNAWDNTANFIAKNTSNWNILNAGKRKPLADILEIGLVNYKERLAQDKLAYMCSSLLNMWGKGELNQTEVDYALSEINNKIDGAQTLAIYLAEKYPYKGLPACAESFEARTAKDVTKEEKIEFWETWMRNLKRKVSSRPKGIHRYIAPVLLSLTNTLTNTSRWRNKIMNTKTTIPENISASERETAIMYAALFLQDYKNFRRQADRLKVTRTLRAAYAYNEVSSAEYDRLTKELQLAEEAYRKAKVELSTSEGRLGHKLATICELDPEKLKTGGSDNEN